MQFKISGTVKLSFTGVEVEANTMEEAKSKFYNTYIGNYKDLESEASDITEEDISIANDGVELSEAKYTVEVSNIDYDVEEDDVELDITDDLTDEAIEAKIEAIKKTLPQEVKVEVECDPADLEDSIAEAIASKTGWLVNSIGDYRVTEIK